MELLELGFHDTIIRRLAHMRPSQHTAIAGAWYSDKTTVGWHYVLNAALVTLVGRVNGYDSYNSLYPNGGF